MPNIEAELQIRKPDNSLVPLGANADGELLVADETVDARLVAILAQLVAMETQTWTFPQATAQWVLSHNMGRYPAVQTYLLDGTLVIGEVTQVSVNQVTVDFLIPTAGRAVLR